MRMIWLFVIVLCALTLSIGSADAARKKRCNRLCKDEIQTCRSTDCGDLKGKARRKCKAACKKDSLNACDANPDPNDCLPPTTTSTTTSTTTTTTSTTTTVTAPTTTVPTTTTTPTTSTTTTTLYGSPSRAFLDRVSSLLD